MTSKGGRTSSDPDRTLLVNENLATREKCEVMREMRDEHGRCGLCGYSGYRELFEGTDVDFPQEKWRVVKCARCNLVRTDPYPSDPLCYQRDTYDSLHTPKKINRKRKNSELSGMIQDYFRQRLERSYQKIYSERLELLRKYIVQRHIFEVGFGEGKFLAFLRDRGWRVAGIELSKNAFLEAKKRYKLHLEWGKIEEKEYPKENFSLVTMYMVLEHIHKPLELLKSLHRLLREQGILIIQVPNFASLQSKIFRSQWYSLRLPRHMYHYTPKTLQRLLMKASFEVVATSFRARIDNASGFKFSLKKIVCHLLGLERNVYTHKSDTDVIFTRVTIIGIFVDPVFKLLAILEEIFQRGGTMTVVARRI